MISINVEIVNFDANPGLIAHMQSLFGELDKYNDMAVNADVYLKSLSETPTQDKEVSIRLNMPGKDIFIAKQAVDFHTASHEVYDALKVALKRHKDQHKDHHQTVKS